MPCNPPLPVENFHALLEERVLAEVRKRFKRRNARVSDKLRDLILLAMKVANDKGYAGLQDTRAIAENEVWWVETTGGYVGGISVNIHCKIL